MYVTKVANYLVLDNYLLHNVKTVKYFIIVATYSAVAPNSSQEEC